MLFFVAAIAWGLCLQLAATRAPTLTINYGTSNQRYLIAGKSPQSFSLRCDGSSSDAHLVQLKKIETGHFIDPFFDTDYYNNSRVDICSTSPSITWTLRSVTKEIEGTYMCRMISCISSEEQPTYSERSYVFVFDDSILTSVKESPEDGRVVLECPFSITCNANHVNSVTRLVVQICRQKEESECVVEGPASLVYSGNANEDEAGTYFCQVRAPFQDDASNPLETMTVKNPIQIQTPVAANVTRFSSSPLQPNASNVLVIEKGNMTTLSCASVGLQCDLHKAKPTFPYMEISFKSKIRQSRENATAISLPIKPVQISDSGEYVCKASFNSPVSQKSLTLLVTEVVRVTSFRALLKQSDDITNQTCIRTRQEVNIECAADGVPVPAVRILSDLSNSTLASDVGKVSGIFVASELETSTVQFTCFAHNGHSGESVRGLSLGFYESANISLHLSFDSCVQSGETVNISCSATGLPVPTVQIRDSNGTILAEGGNGTAANVSLVVNEATSGNYSCVSTSKCETTERQFSVCFTELVRVTSFRALLGQSDITNQTCVSTGQEVNITCSAKGVPPPTVRILNDLSNSTIASGVGKAWAMFSPFDVKTWREQFICLVHNKYSESRQRLSVGFNESGNISLLLSFHSCVESGKTISIFCSATGLPVPTVQIRDSNGTILAAGGNGIAANVSLVVNERTSGNYSCVSISPCETTKRQFSVCFTELVRVTSFRALLGQSDITNQTCVSTGQEVNITCSAKGVPPPTVRIHDLSNSTLASGVGKAWRIFVASEVEASKVPFTCTAHNDYSKSMQDLSVGFDESSNISLRLSFDSCVQSGETVNISCSATGLPVPTVQILNANATVLAEGNGTAANVSLVVNEATSGNYSCVSISNCETTERQFSVCVEAISPNIYCFQVFSDELNRTVHETQEGKRGHIACLADGSPDPNVTIINDDKEIVATRLSSARFLFVGDKSVEGLYTCIAENRFGAKNRTIFLRISTTNNSNHGGALIIAGVLLFIGIVVGTRFITKRGKDDERKQLLEDEKSRTKSVNGLSTQHKKNFSCFPELQEEIQEKHLTEVYLKIEAFRKRVAHNLGLVSDEIHSCELDHSTNEERCHAMLRKWKKRQRGNGTVWDLASAIYKAELEGVVEEVYGKSVLKALQSGK